MNSRIKRANSGLISQLKSAHRQLALLIDCLKKEQKALTGRDRESLSEILQTKRKTVANVNALLRRLPAPKKNVTTCPNDETCQLTAGIFHPAEQKLWREIQELAELAMQMNQNNANIIQLSRSFFNEYLNKLKDFRKHVCCYHKSSRNSDMFLSNMIINRIT